MNVRDVLLPASDRAVAIQLVVVLALVAVALRCVRREPALVELVLGLGLVIVGLMGVRALH